MGLFDGYGGREDAGSAAHLARLLDAPVLLVVDAWAMARSTAALVHGFASFDSRVRVGGVILNNLAGEGHYRFIAESLEGSPTPPLGWLRKDQSLSLPERHLGLVPADMAQVIAALAARISEGIDLEAVLALARTAGPLPGPERRVFSAAAEAAAPVRLAIAHDEAFWFYYQDSLEYLEALGAELVPFSPLRDRRPPEPVQGVYLGGGYPELYLDALSENTAIKTWLRGVRVPVYGECGGLMYLTQSIRDQEGRIFPMVGRLDTEATMQGRGLRVGYVTATARCHHLLARPGEAIRGHEFHASRLTRGPEAPAWLCSGAVGDPHVEGFAETDLLASYVHVHLAANPTAATVFIAACRSRAPE